MQAILISYAGIVSCGLEYFLLTQRNLSLQDWFSMQDGS